MRDLTLDADLMLDEIGVQPQPEMPAQKPAQKPTGERNPFDNYSTPYDVALQGVRWLQKIRPAFKPEVMLEAGCGDFQPFMQATRKIYNCTVLGVDIRPVAPQLDAPVPACRDFLQWEGRADLVATNPPYSLTEEFIEHTVRKVLLPGGLGLSLTRLSILASIRRYTMWRDHVYLLDVGVCAKRPSFTGDGATDVKTDYCFIVFTRYGRAPEQPRLWWLPPDGDPNDDVFYNEG